MVNASPLRAAVRSAWWAAPMPAASAPTTTTRRPGLMGALAPLRAPTRALARSARSRLGLLRPEVHARVHGEAVDLGELGLGQRRCLERVEVGVELLDAGGTD